MIEQSRRMESPLCGDLSFEEGRTGPLQRRVFVSERTSLPPEFIPKHDGMLDHFRAGEQGSLFLLHKLCKKILHHAREVIGHCFSLLHKVFTKSEIYRPFARSGRYAQFHLNISFGYAHIIGTSIKCCVIATARAPVGLLSDMCAQGPVVPLRVSPGG